MEIFKGCEHIVRENESLAPYTWFRLGGSCQYFAEPTNLAELKDLVCRCHEHELPVRMLGGGSNLLVRDQQVAGLVLHLSAPSFADITVDGSVLHAGCGAKLGNAVSISVREGLAGLEQLVGIPGTIGGALHSNSGTQGGDIGQWVSRVTVMTRTGEVLQREKGDLRFAYRKSSLDELVIVNATFELEAADAGELTKRMQTLWILKRASQPKAHSNYGCIFKDCDGTEAASLIEQAGLRGTSQGAATISADNCNFIVAEAGATSDDVLRLIETARQQVAERLGVELETQIEIW